MHAYRLEERNTILQKTYEEQVMVACTGRGRTFSGQDRLDVHMRGCKAAKPVSALFHIHAEKPMHVPVYHPFVHMHTHTHTHTHIQMHTQTYIQRSYRI